MEAKDISNSTAKWAGPELAGPELARPNLMPVIPALHELAEASHVLAQRSEELIVARNNHTEARERWNNLRDEVAANQEKFGV